TVGYRTVEIMAQFGASVLAIEAGKTLLVDKKKMVSFADDKGISIVAI
ncbi:MAG: UDP-2,3-diacylglucosamine diphosphatase LpxI, partial [Selenomonadaceae bacterium]|nr:UDP-2,3-diacylglucosamine diphosphatase LpxI [Selenomonadaceae bacterium]